MPDFGSNGSGRTYLGIYLPMIVITLGTIIILTILGIIIIIIIIIIIMIIIMIIIIIARTTIIIPRINIEK